MAFFFVRAKYFYRPVSGWPNLIVEHLRPEALGGT